MRLNECEINKNYKIKNINVEDNKFKIRLQELGLFIGNEISVLNFSPLKKTLLITIFNSVFALKLEIAKSIEVE